MINFHDELIYALESILPTHYEMVLTSKTPKPCISYMELTNYDEAIGDTIEYSRLHYQIKVWGDNIGIINEYARCIDKKLKPLGFRRTSSGELYDNNSSTIQKIMSYELLAFEIFE